MFTLSEVHTLTKTNLKRFLNNIHNHDSMFSFAKHKSVSIFPVFQDIFISNNTSPITLCFNLTREIQHYFQHALVINQSNTDPHNALSASRGQQMTSMVQFYPLYHFGLFAKLNNFIHFLQVKPWYILLCTSPY